MYIYIFFNSIKEIAYEPPCVSPINVRLSIYISVFECPAGHVSVLLFAFLPTFWSTN